MPRSRSSRRNQEIAPEDIFLESTALSDLDRVQFKGRLETPLSPGTLAGLFASLCLLFVVLVGRAWHLQIQEGEVYAGQSAQNSLETRILFAPRGVIEDVRGTVLAANSSAPDGSMVRTYPYLSLAPLMGYVSYPKKDRAGNYYAPTETGVTGIEAEYDALLAGRNGELLTEVDALGRVRSEGTIVPVTEGSPLKLSIDAALHDALYTALARIAREKNFLAGGAVILDVHTGAVRALVSYPSYDPEVMSNGAPADLIQKYSTQTGRPFLNHATQGVYAPGSIVKPLVASGALTDGVITPTTVINDPGSISIDDPYRPGKKYVYTGWKALGLVDVKKAIAWSSDIYFYTVGGGYKSQQGLGIERLAYWYRAFGLGSTTGIDISGEAEGVIPTPAWKKAVFDEPWYLGDTYFTAIGQYGMQVTPLQMARAIAAVANGGVLVTPTLLAGVRKESVRVPVNPDLLPVVRAGMRLTVTDALATALNFPYVSVAAKTGTAQTGTRNQYDNSWVVGFFPSQAPQYAFAVVLERGPEGSGSQAVNVMAELFQDLAAHNSMYTGGIATSTAR